MSGEEFEEDVIRRNFLLPYGMEWEAGWAFQEPTGHIVVVSMMRAKGLTHFSDEQLARLNLLKPDIARAAYMSSRLAFSEARSMTETLSMLGLPAAVIGDGGQAVAMNPEMETLAPRIRAGAGDRLVLEGVGANALLDEAIQHYKAQSSPTVQSLPMAGRDGAPPLILHLLPVRRAARDIFPARWRCWPSRRSGRSARRTCGCSAAFSTTPAEARVARGIAIAQTPEMIAATLGISLETARSHLKKIMQKTGTTRQAELVLLLSGLNAPSVGGARED